MESECSYCSVPEFNTYIDHHNPFIIFNQNIRSFNHNYVSLSVFLSDFDKRFEIIVLTETWFREGACYNIDGYSGYHTYRTERSGGGVSVYVRKNIRSIFLKEFSVCTEEYETCVVEVSPNIENKKHNFFVFSIYRPPNSSKQLFKDYISNLSQKFNNKPLLLLGDLNIDILDEINNLDFCNVMYSQNFFPLINIPTRITNTTAKCLDHIWYYSFNSVRSGSFILDISDHYPVFTALNVDYNNEPIKQIFRNHSQANIDNLIERISDLSNNYSRTFSNSGINEKTEWFMNEFWNIYNQCCPKKTKTISYKKLTKPWINNNIKSMINQKHCLFKQYKCGTIHFETYNHHKNYITKILKAARSNYYSTKFSESRNNVKSNWKTINSILGRTKKNCDLVTLVNEEGREVSNPTDVSNMFCNYFSSVATYLDNRIPQSQSDPMSYMPPRITSSFFATPASLNEVIDIIKALPNKNCGIDSIPIFIYKKLSPFLAPIICDIFNTSVSEGTFPNILKLARIIPIHKNKSLQVVNNFRPISILTILSKLIERLMKCRTERFIDKNNILTPKQYGFRTNYSTADPVLEFTDH